MREFEVVSSCDGRLLLLKQGCVDEPSSSPEEPTKEL